MSKSPAGKAVDKRSRARQKFGELLPPRTTMLDSEISRDEWMSATCNGFVAKTPVNKAYYRIVLEMLWPDGHGIPGPHVSETEIRAAINSYRKKERVGKKPDKDYLDVFRRVRELQGEEGILGIVKQGKTYQLIDLTLGAKRIPRIGLSQAEWEQVLTAYNYRCANCGKEASETRLDQDHKVPRVRSGGDEISNWQPLCAECNNFKSTACRGCKLDCFTCPWAFPAQYAPLKLLHKNTEAVRARALEASRDASELLNEIVETHLGLK